MDMVRVGRSAGGRLEAASVSPEPANKSSVADTSAKHRPRQPADQCHYEQQQQQQHPKTRSIKMFNKVQVVYYLTRNGHLEHPHYIEVPHLATQPLRLRDVIERLTMLRGKAMPCQYSWSCKRSYKNGFVWNDLTENDAIYASEGSEYVLKGSELIQDRDYPETRLEEVHNKGRQQRKDTTAKLDTNGLITAKVHPRHNHRRIVSDHGERRTEPIYHANDNCDEFEEEEEEEEVKRVSCNSSNATCYTKQAVDDCQLMEQEESYSLPSTSSTNSDKLPLPPAAAKPTVALPKQAKATANSQSKRFEKDVTIEEDGDPIPSPLTRNAVLLQLIACGGGTLTAKAKTKGNNKNFNMRNTFIPCLKQQLSTRGVSTVTNNPLHRGAEQRNYDCKAANADHRQVTKEEEDDEDMIMVRYMSENPRFGNLQSEEKEYFSGTIVETMTTHHHTPSSGSESGLAHVQHHSNRYPSVFTKSSSYNEQRSAKAGLEAAAAKEGEEDENEDVKLTGIIKLCLPRKKSCSSTSAKSSRL